MDSKPTSSISSSGNAPSTPPPWKKRRTDSHAPYRDHASSSSTPSSSATPLTWTIPPVDPQPSTSSLQTPDQTQDNQQSSASSHLLSYLRSLSVENRMAQDLYSVSIQDLLEASLLQPPLLENHNALFLEALKFTEINNTFTSVPCYFCKTFNSSSTGANTTHVIQEHIGIRPLEMLDMYPKQAPDSWITGDHNLQWSPLDPTTFEPDTSSTKGERIWLLAQIKRVFMFLASNGMLTVSHMAALVDLAPTITSRDRLVESTLKQSNFCIRVLGAPQLQTALRFLEAIKTWGLDINTCGTLFEETLEEEKFQLFLEPDKVSVILMNYGKQPGDLVRWLYDPSDEVSSSSWNVVLKSRDHKIRLVMREYLYVLVRLVRNCQMKKRRLDHSNAMTRLRYLGLDELNERFCTSEDIEKIAIGEILQEMWDLHESDQETRHIQYFVYKKIRQLHLKCLLIDARILSALKYLDELHPKIGIACELDYCKVVAPLMKYCIKKRLKNLMEQKAWHLSEPEREADITEPSDQPADDEALVGAYSLE